MAGVAFGVGGRSGVVELWVRHQWCEVHAALDDDRLSLTLHDQTSGGGAEVNGSGANGWTTSSGSRGGSSSSDTGGLQEGGGHGHPPENLAGTVMLVDNNNTCCTWVLRKSCFN